jgi:hypothetical protein
MRIAVLRIAVLFGTLEFLAVEEQHVMRCVVDDAEVWHGASLADFRDLETVERQRIDQHEIGRLGLALGKHRPQAEALVDARFPQFEGGK